MTMLSFFQVGQPEAPSPTRPHRTLRHYAAFCGRRKFVKVLTLEHSKHASVESVDSPSFDGESAPLHLASGEGHVGVIRFLVDQDDTVTSRVVQGSCGIFTVSRSARRMGADTATRIKTVQPAPLHVW
jgi:hypothetical protein